MRRVCSNNQSWSTDNKAPLYASVLLAIEHQSLRTWRPGGWRSVVDPHKLQPLLPPALPAWMTFSPSEQ